MHGSTLQKMARLVRHLSHHPQDLRKYLATSLPKKLTPLGLQLPWFSYSAIEFLEGFLSPSLRVFEYGGGGSTIFFAKRTAHVITIENNQAWADKIQTVLHHEKIQNATVQFHPYKPNDLEAFIQSAYLGSLKKESPDVIVIDGYEEAVPLRPVCFQLAETVIKPGGIIVVDDAWRYADIIKNHHAKRRCEFQSIGPCRPGITSTDIYFY